MLLFFIIKKCGYECPFQFKAVVYRRYVDDIFVLFKSEHLNFLLRFFAKPHLVEFLLITVVLIMLPKGEV